LTSPESDLAAGRFLQFIQNEPAAGLFFGFVVVIVAQNVSYAEVIHIRVIQLAVGALAERR
jgi:hypothetical protein